MSIKRILKINNSWPELSNFCFNLDQSNILSSGNGLNKKKGHEGRKLILQYVERLVRCYW